MGDHTEAIQVEYDPTLFAYADVLRYVATAAGRNGSQTRQYMTGCWWHDDDQARLLADLVNDRPYGYLHVAPFQVFYRAEDYHQMRSSS